MINTKIKEKALGRPVTTWESLPYLFFKHYRKYALKQITQKELATLCKTSRQSISKYIKIYKKTEDEIAENDWLIEEKKRMQKEKKEKEYLKNIKNWAYEELVEEAQNETCEYEQDGISDYTPAIRELKRRGYNVENIMYGNLYILDEAFELDF